MNLITLKEFLAHYIDWIDAGAPVGKPFHRNEGLCWNFRLHLQRRVPLADGMWRRARAEELVALFAEDGLNPHNPFHETVMASAEEESAGRCHQNPARIAWVRSRLERTIQEMAILQVAA